MARIGCGHGTSYQQCICGVIVKALELFITLENVLCGQGKLSVAAAVYKSEGKDMFIPESSRLAAMSNGTPYISAINRD